MVIVRKKKFNESGWQSSSNKELFNAAKANLGKRISLFEVGPDRYIVLNGKGNFVDSGRMFLITCKDGLSAGFHFSQIDRVEKWVENNRFIFDLLVGNREFKLEIN